MSPKVPRYKQNPSSNISITKLALKKNLRKSSIFDKRTATGEQFVVSSSTESSSLTNTANKSSSSSPIVISDSESDCFDDALVDIQKKTIRKTTEIESWIKSVNLESNDGRMPMHCGESSIACVNIKENIENSGSDKNSGILLDCNIIERNERNGTNSTNTHHYSDSKLKRTDAIEETLESNNTLDNSVKEATANNCEYKISIIYTR